VPFYKNSGKRDALVTPRRYSWLYTKSQLREQNFRRAAEDRANEWLDRSSTPIHDQVTVPLDSREREFTIPARLNKDELKAFNGGDGWLLIVGRVGYSDWWIFDRTAKVGGFSVCFKVLG
jgi:hypothetical protein